MWLIDKNRGAPVVGAVGGVSNAALGGGSAGDIAFGGFSGLLGAGIGLGVSSATAPWLSKMSVNINGYSSPFIDGLVKGSIGGAIGGGAAGFGVGMIYDPQNAFKYAGSGALSGGISGGITGSARSSFNAMDKGQNPFTGRYTNITTGGIERIQQHLQKLGEGQGYNWKDDADNFKAMENLKIGRGLKFYQHEMLEIDIMDKYNLQFNYEGAREGHLKTLETQGIKYQRGYEIHIYGDWSYKL